MFQGIGFGAERIGFAAVAFPRWAAACLIALLILIGVSLPKVSFDDDIHRVFLSNSPLSQAQRAYDAAQIPPLSTILIHVTSAQVLSASDMIALRDLSLELEFLEGVNAVVSPFVLRWPPTPETPSGTPVFGTRINADFADDLKAFKALRTGLPRMINDNNTAVLLSVSIDTTQTTVASAVEAITAETQRMLPDTLTAHLTGEDVISAEIVTGLKDDLIALNLWGAMIVTFAALALLRDLRMTLLAVVPALFGAAGVMGLSVWLGYPITVLSNVIPILLLVLGVADGVHLAAHLKQHGTLRDTIQSIGPPCALTALTTAVAFASIMLTGNTQLFEFAVLGALGTVLSFVIVIVTFALLGRVVTPTDRPVPLLSTKVAQRLAALGAARPQITVAVCILLLGAATLGFAQTKSWFPLYQNLPGASPTRATNDAIANDFGGVFRMIVETSGPWAETRTLVENLEAISGPETVLSEINFARWLGTPDARPKSSDIDALPQVLVDQLRGTDHTARIFISTPEPMRSADTLLLFDALEATAYASGADRVFGLPTIMRQEAVTLIQQLSLGLVLATLGATLLVAVAFRSLRLIPVLIIPNTLPLMLTGASLHLWAQGQLSPTAVLALTIAFGIAIDDTVHFLSRFRHASATGETRQQAVQSAARSAGQVMVLTTALLCCGLCVTFLSDFAPIRLFGGMMIVTLLAALLVDLLLLPALLTWKRGTDATV